MCIIISKDKKCDRLPTVEELTNCFEYNKDGAGFMYVNDGKVIIEKGFMTLTDFLSRFKNLCDIYNDFKNKSLVIHCRIGTSSGNTPENTHPYAITTKEKKLHKLYDETDLAVVHNGIISAYTPKNKNATVNDTQKFILEYLAPIHKHYKTAYKMEKFRDGIKNITNSKFVFLDANDRTYYVGDFIDENGLKFSNTTYKTFTTYISKYSKYFYDDYYDDYYDNYYDDKTKNYKSDDNFEYYNISKEQIYLDKKWHFYGEESQLYFDVKDFEYDLIYDLNEGALYYLDDDGALQLFESLVTVYDEELKEVY